MKPPATREEGEKAPLGTYIPYIDPDVYFAKDGSQYLYFSRNAYRNWNRDADLGKYVEESNILAVSLTRAWWKTRPAARCRRSHAPTAAPTRPRAGPTARGAMAGS